MLSFCKAITGKDRLPCGPLWIHVFTELSWSLHDHLCANSCGPWIRVLLHTPEIEMHWDYIPAWGKQWSRWLHPGTLKAPNRQEGLNIQKWWDSRAQAGLLLSLNPGKSLLKPRLGTDFFNDVFWMIANSSRFGQQKDHLLILIKFIQWWEKGKENSVGSVSWAEAPAHILWPHFKPQSHLRIDYSYTAFHREEERARFYPWNKKYLWSKHIWLT